MIRAAVLFIGALVLAPIVFTGSGPTLAVIGMSNAGREADTFLSTYGNQLDYTFVNSAAGRCSLTKVSNPDDGCWRRMLRLIPDVNAVTHVWVKVADRPHHNELRGQEFIEDQITKLQAVVANVRVVFPNVETIYVSGRSYAGHARDPVEEDLAHASAFDIVPAVLAADSTLTPGPFLHFDDDPASYFARDGVHPNAGFPWDDRLCTVFCDLGP